MAITTIKDKDKDHLVLASAMERLDLAGSRIRGKLDSLSFPFFRPANFSRTFFFPHYLRAWNG